MFLYSSTILLIICAIFLLLMVHINIKLKFESGFYSNELQELKKKNLLLEQNQHMYIQKVEQLSEKLKYQEMIISDFQQLKEKSTESTKAVLFELGNKLSNHLIEINKKENTNSREHSERTIQKTIQQFNTEFERIVGMVGSLSQEIAKSTDVVDVIKNALLSPSGAGALAEITLENIMKSSGLILNIDYRMQYTIKDENQNILRPDSIVFLPNHKVMIIDAKSSKFLVESSLDTKALAKTMNLHLRSLSDKAYIDSVRHDLSSRQDTYITGSIIILMFLPTEQAVEKLLDADNDFMNKAWKKNIFPVGPTGLMNMLSFAKFQISEHMMLHNQQKIITEVQKLITSIKPISEHATKLGSSISSVVNYYDKFAASFNKNFLFKARNIRKMGIETSIVKEQEYSLHRLQVVVSPHSDHVDDIDRNTTIKLKQEK